MKAKIKQESGSIDFGVLPELLGYQVRMTQIAIFRDFAKALDEFAITPTLFGSLVIIYMNPGIKQSDLAEAVRLDRSSVVPMIDRLESKGLVIREKQDNDRRTNALSLTPEGVELTKSLIPLVREHEKHMARELSNDEQNQLVTLLEKIRAD